MTGEVLLPINDKSIVQSRRYPKGNGSRSGCDLDYNVIPVGNQKYLVVLLKTGRYKHVGKSCGLIFFRLYVGAYLAMANGMIPPGGQ